MDQTSSRVLKFYVNGVAKGKPRQAVTSYAVITLEKLLVIKKKKDQIRYESMHTNTAHKNNARTSI